MTKPTTKLRITPDGRIQGLWTDDVQLCELGVVRVRRASHVEFDDSRQCWTVRPANSASFVRKWLDRLLGRPSDRIVHREHSRSRALAWEHENFQPGGPFWPQLTRSIDDRSNHGSDRSSASL